MSGKQYFRLVHTEARRRASKACQDAPDGHIVTIAEAGRTLDQNAAMWPILQAFADQLQWPVNGAMVWMTTEEWKDVLSAAYKRESVRVAMGLDGGVVMLGCRTSKFGVREMSDFIEFLHATAAARDVDIRYQEYA